MIQLARTGNLGVVKAMATHPKLYGRTADDFAPPPEQFVAPPWFWYVLVYDDSRPVGMFTLEPRNGILAEIHTDLLPEAWGPRALEIVKELAGWVWANTPFKRITTTVPAYNRLALRLAEKAGMKQFGINQKSFQKNGVLHDQILLGISAPGIT